MSEAALRDLLVRYLAGSATLRDLDQAISAVAWNPSAEQSVRDLAQRVALRLDEYTSGYGTSEQLQAALRPFVTKYAVHVQLGAASNIEVHTAASSLFVPSQGITTLTVVGTRREEVPS
jgi:hypothetical protein